MRGILSIFLKALILIVAMCFTLTASAQYRAGLQGSVTDAQGGAVSGATVTLLSKETNQNRQTTTNEDGIYRFSGLPPGRYSLSIEQPGFKKQVVDDIPVAAEETQGKDVTLEAGGVNETVTVNDSQGAQLQTENGNETRAISTMEVRGLPQFGRDPYELLRTTPGVIGDGARNSSGNALFLGGQSTGPGGSNTSIFQTENQVQVSANGQRVTSNNFQVDGVSVNSLGWGGAAVITPNQESVKEVRVISSTYTAEIGRNSGAQVEVVSQNGTNDLHGSAFFKYDQPGLNAVNKFPGATTQTGRVNRAFRNYGGSFGGPLLLPRFGEGGKSYSSGTNRRFFFFSFEGIRENLQTVSFNQPVETAQFRNYIIGVRPNSNAARLFSTSGIAPRIANVINTPCPSNPPPGSLCNQVSGGLDIGSLNLSRPTGAYYGFNPVVNGSNQAGGGLDGIPDIQFANILIPNQTRGKQYNLRLDFNQGKNIYTFSGYLTSQNSRQGASNGRPIGDLTFKPKNAAITATWIRTLSANAVNEARGNFTRFAYDQIADIGDANFGVPFLNIFDFDTPIRGGFTIGAPRGGTTPARFAQNTYEGRDTLTWTRGNQTYKFGVEVRREQDNNDLSGGARPLYQFEKFWNFANDAVQFEAIDFDPRTGGLPNGQRYFRTNTFAGFVQDDWKVRPNLTVNLGLRYEYFSPLTEKEGRVSNYVFGSNGYINGSVVGGLDSLYQASKRNFAPRLGFAYTPGLLKDKAVLRGGFGIAYNRLYDNIFSDIRQNPPFLASAGLCCNNIDNPTSAPIFYTFGTSSSPFSYPGNPALTKGIDPKTGGVIGVPVDVVGTPPNMPTPYIYNYSLELQYQLPFRLVTTVGYIGSSSHKLVRTVDLNRFAPGDTFDNVRDRFQNVGSNLQPCGPTNPTCLAPHATGNAAFNRIFFRLPDVNANYNALIVRLTRNFANGLQFDGNYTFGKSIDTQSFELGAQQTDPSLPGSNRGPSDYDIRHSFIMSAIYSLPFFGKSEGWERRVLGGFEISSIVSAHSGLPWTPSVFGDEATDLNGDGFRPDRPLAYLGGAIQNPTNKDFLTGIFPVDAAHPRGGPDYFVTTGHGPAGIGRNSFRGPRYFNIDISVAKTVGLPRFISELANIELRANFFNAFNIQNLAPIQQVSAQTDIGNVGNFGKSPFALSGRVIELQARFRF